MEDWESVKARLEQEGAGNQTIAADIRTALERVEELERERDAEKITRKALVAVNEAAEAKRQIAEDGLRATADHRARVEAMLDIANRKLVECGEVWDAQEAKLAEAQVTVRRLTAEGIAFSAEVERLRDIISPGDAAAYEQGMAALQAEVMEWRDTARSEMAGRRAAEAEVERLHEVAQRFDGLLAQRIRELEAEVGRLRQAVGLATTCAPGMEMDPEHPVEMMREVCRVVSALRQRVEELEVDADHEQGLRWLAEMRASELSALHTCAVIEWRKDQKRVEELARAQKGCEEHALAADARAEAAEAKLEQARIDRDAAVADAVSIGQESKRMEAELARLREAGQRCMKISIGFAAAGIVGHVQILDVMGAALAPEVKP